MRRSDLMRLTELTAGGAAGAPLANTWHVHHGWTDAARAASLAVRRAKAAARAASAGADSGLSSGSSTSSSDSSSGGGDPENSGSPVRVSGFTVNGRGKVSVGFTDYTVDPPVNRYLTEGGEDGGWTIKSADYDAGTAVLLKDGQEISVGMASGGGPAPDGSGPSAEEQAADQAEWRDGQGAAGAPVEDFADAGIGAFHDRYGRPPASEDDCKEAAGLSGAATDSDLEAVEERIRERAADDADAGTGESGGGEEDPAVHARALEMVRGAGPDAEPPSFDDLTAVLNADLESCRTPEDRLAALNEYRASIEAGRLMWDSAAAFEALNGRKPESGPEWRVAEKLAGVPAPFLKGGEGAGADGGGEAIGNRRRLRRSRLSNRADAAAGCLLANVGWTDEARAASLAVRRGGSSAVKRDPLSDARDLLAAFPGGIGNRPSPEAFDAARKEFARTYCRDPRTPQEWAQAFYFLRQFPHANRLRRSGGGALANTGWTDEARAAALLARRAKADARGADAAPPRVWVAGTPGQDGPPVRGVTGSAGDAAVRAPSPPSEGTIVNAGGWISVMTGGKLVRIGSAKVLCVLPDGQLGVKRGGKAYPIGRPGEWGSGVGGARIVTGSDGKRMLDVGKGYLDLSTGQVKVKPGQDGVKIGGKVKIVIDRHNPFLGGGVDIPPDPPDISQRRYLRA